jgi:uncharacterized repeat protein (TIGR03803 family)
LSWVPLLCAAVTIVSHAQGFETLGSFRFSGNPQYAPLIQGNDRVLYGTTTGDWGTVFRITTGGGLTVVCYFGESDCPDGAFPFAGLLQAADGNFYGTAWQGASGSNTVYGAGTIFEIPTIGQPITLYGFCSESKCRDGADPFAPLVQAKNGSFYGAAFDGGAKGYGTLFEFSAAGKLTTLHSFQFEDGAGPVGGLIQAKDGSFYGTTLYGGANGAGTVFRITPSGELKTLHSFGSAGDGANPYSQLVQATDENFYGTTYSGGKHAHGTIFRMAASGTLTTLYSFCSQKKCTDGAYPYAGLIQATDGNFYGTTSQGGSSNWGALFAFTPEGVLTVLHSFCQEKNCTDGADPVAGLLQAADGNFYGTTAQGGVYEDGTVFSMSLGVFPFVGNSAASGEAARELGGFGARYLRPTSASDPLGRLHLTHDGQSTKAAAPGPLNSDLTCSPVPCVLPPTQASEGGGIVTDSPIVGSPTNAKHLLLGSFDGNCSGLALLGFHLSTDGGSTWSRHCMPTIQKDRMYSPVDDPQVGYDLKGIAYISGYYFAVGAGFVGFQKSNDGVRWSKAAPALRLKVGTHPFDSSLTVDRTPGSPRANNVYISAAVAMDSGRKTQVMVSHSSDKGASWAIASIDSPQRVPVEDRLTRISVNGEGVIYVTWMRSETTTTTGYIMASRSSDGGNTWSSPLRVATVTMAPDLPNAQGERVYNYPGVAVDNSGGSYSGNVYVAMYNWTGTHLSVQVIRSTDGGKTWSQPVPVAPPSATHDQFFPAISVSSTGTVGVSWLDRRNDPADLSYQAYAAFSDDGGKTFKKNWQLTTAFSDPDTNGTMNHWMGDYTGNAWDGNTFIAAWMDSSNGFDMQEVVGGVRLK